MWRGCPPGALHVDDAAADGEGGFFDDLGEGGVSVDRAGDVFGAGGELHGDGELSDEGTGASARGKDGCV